MYISYKHMYECVYMYLNGLYLLYGSELYFEKVNVLNYCNVLFES